MRRDVARRRKLIGLHRLPPLVRAQRAQASIAATNTSHIFRVGLGRGPTVGEVDESFAVIVAPRNTVGEPGPTGNVHYVENEPWDLAAVDRNINQVEVLWVRFVGVKGDCQAYLRFAQMLGAL